MHSLEKPSGSCTWKSPPSRRKGASLGLYGDDRGISKVHVLHFSSKAPKRESLAAKLHNTSFMEERAVQVIPVNESRKKTEAQRPLTHGTAGEQTSHPKVLCHGVSSPKNARYETSRVAHPQLPLHLSMVWPALDLNQEAWGSDWLPWGMSPSKCLCSSPHSCCPTLLTRERPEVLLLAPGWGWEVLLRPRGDGPSCSCREPLSHNCALSLLLCFL